ncbi:MAG: M23 family metallopeptidase [Syntrophomonadaceae bacterium]|nr:M23 family metallopeptidase [Syntrophomonadaceae bacterium]
MKLRFISILVISIILIIGCNPVPVSAGLTEGSFVPSCNLQSVTVDSRILVYQVKPGDTLWNLSRMYNVDLNTICAINNLDQKSILAIGQTLRLPYNRARIHIVSKGETLWDIAAKYDVSLSDLIRLNSKVDPKRLQIGEQLQIPGSTMVAVYKQEPSRSALAPFNYFIWPLIGTITSNYGWRKSGFHHGLDIAGSIGDTIRAAAAGEVSFSGFKAVYGRTIVIDHPDGKQSLYAHLQRSYVREGDMVSRGQSIGTVGITGNTTGPHLHFEVKVNGKAQNPLSYLNN